MKRILLRIWSVWFYILFFGYFIMLFPLYVIFISIKKKWSHDIAHSLNTLWGWVITLPTGVRIKVVNKNKIRRNGVYLFAPNHTSYLDIPACNLAIPVTYRYMGKYELNSIPLFGWMFNRLYIAVNRGSRMESYRSFVRVKEKLQEGTSVLIYPEATIPDKTKVMLGRFKDGVFRLAVENKVPIVPVVIINADRVLFDDEKFILNPGTIKVILGDPIEVKGDENPNELRTLVYDIMLKALESEGVTLVEPKSLI